MFTVIIKNGYCNKGAVTIFYYYEGFRWIILKFILISICNMQEIVYNKSYGLIIYDKIEVSYIVT